MFTINSQSLPLNKPAWIDHETKKKQAKQKHDKLSA